MFNGRETPTSAATSLHHQREKKACRSSKEERAGKANCLFGRKNSRVVPNLRIENKLDPSRTLQAEGTAGGKNRASGSGACVLHDLADRAVQGDDIAKLKPSGELTTTVKSNMSER